MFFLPTYTIYKQTHTAQNTSLSLTIVRILLKQEFETERFERDLYIGHHG